MLYCSILIPRVVLSPISIGGAFRLVIYAEEATIVQISHFHPPKLKTVNKPLKVGPRFMVDPLAYLGLCWKMFCFMEKIQPMVRNLGPSLKPHPVSGDIYTILVLSACERILSS